MPPTIYDSQSGSADVAPEKPERKWTVMVFMGADTIKGNAPLDHAVDADLKEMHSKGGAKTLDIFVEVHHTRTSAQRYHFGVDGSPDPEEIPGNEAEPALVKFIKDSVKKSKHRRQDYLMLVLWGHAYDFAFARARTRTGVVDSIDFLELSELLQKLQDELKEVYREEYGDVSDVRPTLDIIGFDACDIATVEMACQLQPFAKYLLGSEIGIPIPGWPYDRIFDRLEHPIGRLMAPSEFGSYVVRRFCESYIASTPVSLTFLDLSHATRLRNRGESLALALAASIDNRGYRERITDLFKRSQTGEGRPFVDVADLCLSLNREAGNPTVVEAARALGDLLLSPGPSVVGLSQTGEGTPFIAEHGRNAGELARLNGISLYAPHVASKDFEAVRGIYDKFVFARKTRWSELVHFLARFS